LPLRPRDSGTGVNPQDLAGTGAQFVSGVAPGGVHAVLPDSRSAPARMRVPGARRTCSLDVEWLEGRGGPLRLHGRARDCIATTAHGVRVLAEDALTADFSPRRELLHIELEPARPEVCARFTGATFDALRSLRIELEAARRITGPLVQLIDDLPVVLVVSDWAWSRWPERLHPDEAARRRRHLARFEGVCVGFRPGSSALSAGDFQESKVGRALPGACGPDPDCPEHWHQPAEVAGVSLRRARCIDVWTDGAKVRVEATFQDSASMPEGGRAVVHEYTMRLEAERASGVIGRIEVIPHVLPFDECLGALEHLDDLVGVACADLREAVPRVLARTRGCSHLNDALRALAAVPELLAALDAAAMEAEP